MAKAKTNAKRSRTATVEVAGSISIHGDVKVGGEVKVPAAVIARGEEAVLDWVQNHVAILVRVGRVNLLDDCFLALADVDMSEMKVRLPREEDCGW